MTVLIAKTWFPEKFINNSPAMPCGVISSSSEHREKEQSLKHVSPLSGLEDFAVELESDPTAKQIVGQLLDVNALLADSMKLENPGLDSEIPAIVTKLLSLGQKCLLAQKPCQQFVRKQKDL